MNKVKVVSTLLIGAWVASIFVDVYRDYRRKKRQNNAKAKASC